jgi:23S rRNA pseudouridine2605 synthase
MKQGERIAKAIARAGLASRREAEAWIEAGRVAVNGEVIASPARNVTATDRVTVDGAPLPTRERTRLFLYHKPRGLVTTNADPEGRPTVFDALPKHLPRLLSVGRLDIGTEGLLLLTNDGGLARVLELPDTGWLRRYRVRALGRVMQPDLDRLRGGVTVDGVHYGPVEATLDREQGSNVWLTFAIREGKNREVRNVLGHIGLQVNRLIRVSFGPFQLGEIAEGAVEEVRSRVLRDQLGERIIEEAHCDFTSPIVQREEEEPEEPRRERGGRQDRGERGERPSRGRDDRPGPRRDDRGGRGERPQRGRDDRGGRGERPQRGRDDRGRRGERPQRGRDDRGGRGERPQRGRDDRGGRGERPQRGRDDKRGQRRDDDRKGGWRDHERSDKPPGRPRRGAAWRSEDAPLRRHYRGGGDERRQAPNETAGPKRAGLVSDRKGRRVLVERFGEKKQRDDAPARNKRFGDKRPGDKRSGDKRFGARPPKSHGSGRKRGRPDRSQGPRPSRPRAPKEE